MKKRRVLAMLLALSLTVGMNGITAFATGMDAAQMTQMSAEDQEIDPGEDDPETPVDLDSQSEPETGSPADGGGAQDEASQTQESDISPQSDELETFTDDTGKTITYNTYEAAGYQYTVEDGVLTQVLDASNQKLSGEVVLSQPADTASAYTSIAASAFAGNTAVTYVKLPSGVTSVADGAFQNCTKLKGVYLPATVTSIGASAFEGCSAMTQLAIPKNTQTIGDRAFAGDTKLFMVYMKTADYSKLKTIGASAFDGCTSLEKFCSDTTFNLPDSVVTIGDRAFYGCSKISQVLMSDNVTSLGTYAFANCAALKTVTLSSGLSTISEHAFENCSGLQLVTFGNNNLSVTTEIKGTAFKKCTSLGSIELPAQVGRVDAKAFEGCSALQRVYIKNDRVVLEAAAFPITNDNLCLVGAAGSTAATYASSANIRFVAANDTKNTEYYTYTYSLTGAGTDTKNPITLKVTNQADNTASDINKLTAKVNNKTVKGVKAGTDLYIYIQYGTNTYASLVQGSLKCNGEEITKSTEGIWHTTMPIGGAVITAEFENNNSSVKISGTEDNVSAELSGGSDLKVGQTTKLFLTSDHPNDESQISSSKITYSITSSSPAGVVSVADDGTIKALAAGTANVTAKVTGSAGEIAKTVTIKVSEADVEKISLKATGYDASVITVTQLDDGSTKSASMNSNSATKAYSFTLKATAYDSADDDMAVALKWTSSNSKVAKLTSASTTAASPSNTVTIPSGTSGEATITVTATKQDKTTVTQTFTVSVRDYTPKLSKSSITVNPNQAEGTLLEIIASYPEDNAVMDASTVELINAKEGKNLQEFSLTQSTSTDSVLSFRVTASASLSDGTYNQKVKVQVGNTLYKLPLTITVKSSSPSPKIAFAKNQTKLNLFQKTDNTEFVINVTNLGQDKVAGYELKALTTSADDAKFLSNFQITKQSDNSCTITRTATELQYTSKNKPAVTGYLVLTFDGYQSTFTKQYKITIPTQNTKPSYALSRTSDTYYAGSAAQTVDVQLVDKRNKNALVDMGNAENEYNGYTVSVSGKGTRSVTQASLTTNDAGEAVIRMQLSANPTAGKVYLVVGNKSWSDGQTFTYVYTIKTSKKTPQIKLTTSTVNLNSQYPEEVMTFGLKSNQTGTVISGTQTFTANTNSKTKASLLNEYAKLSVTYTDGKGKVSIKAGQDVAKGTYTFVCNSVNYEYNGQAMNGGKVTLKVKVSNSTSKNAPKVSTSGTMSVNAAASVTTETGTQYADNGELALTVKNLPDGYTFDEQKTVNTIECVSSGYTGYEKRFTWSIVSDDSSQKLVASLAQYCPEGTYSFIVTPKFSDSDKNNTLTAKDLKFKVKVYSGTVSVSLSASGKLNLIDRTGEATADNSVVCTPKFTNLQGQVESAALFDADSSMPIYGTSAVSSLFVVTVKDGLLYVRAKDGAQLENNKTYLLSVWMKVKDYAFDDADGGTWASLSIKTAQSLPKIAADPDTVTLYLSNKDRAATFVIDKQTVNSERPAGVLESVSLDENDSKALASFVNDNGVISSETQADGSLKVTLKLKDNNVQYAGGSTYQVKLYAKFAGQGTNTTGTLITVNVKISN